MRKHPGMGGGPPRAAEACWKALGDIPTISEKRELNDPRLENPTSMLGWDLWHELDERYAFGTLKTVLTVAAEIGRIEESAVDPLSHLLLGAIMQAGIDVARSHDPLTAKRAMTDTFAGIVSAL